MLIHAVRRRSTAPMQQGRAFGGWCFKRVGFWCRTRIFCNVLSTSGRPFPSLPTATNGVSLPTALPTFPWLPTACQILCTSSGLLHHELWLHQRHLGLPLESLVTRITKHSTLHHRHHTCTWPPPTHPTNVSPSHQFTPQKKLPLRGREGGRKGGREGGRE